MGGTWLVKIGCSANRMLRDKSVMMPRTSVTASNIIYYLIYHVHLAGQSPHARNLADCTPVLTSVNGSLKFVCSHP